MELRDLPLRLQKDVMELGVIIDPQTLPEFAKLNGIIVQLNRRKHAPDLIARATNRTQQYVENVIAYELQDRIRIKTSRYE